MKPRVKVYTAGSDAIGVPPHTLEAVVAYVERGRAPSGFLHAVLCNDLFRAAASADRANYDALGVIAAFVIVRVPTAARGSRTSVEWWLRQFLCPICEQHMDVTRDCPVCGGDVCEDCQCGCEARP